jgi:hypothetical protein
MAVLGAVVEGAEGRGIGLGLMLVVGGVTVGALGVEVPDDDAEELCNFASLFKRIYNDTKSKAGWSPIVNSFGYSVDGET